MSTIGRSRGIQHRPLWQENALRRARRAEATERFAQAADGASGNFANAINGQMQGLASLTIQQAVKRIQEQAAARRAEQAAAAAQLGGRVNVTA